MPKIHCLLLVGLLMQQAVQGTASAEPEYLAPVPVRSATILHPLSSPLVGTGFRAVIDNNNRAAVRDFYLNTYLVDGSVAMEWTGSVLSCLPGTTSIAYRDATLSRVNWFRTMVGLPSVTLNSQVETDCQSSALIMIANGMLSHTPPPNWICYTPGGAQVSGESNLSLGNSGPAAVSSQIRDNGDGNYPVGHRRWILYPRLSAVGTGSTSASNGPYLGSNTLWVFGPDTTRPTTPEFVAWPPLGYVPYPLVFARWSFSVNAGYQNVDFSGATVTMTQNNAPVSLSVEALYPTGNSYIGDDTIVWRPEGIVQPVADTTYVVTIGNVMVNGSPRQYQYAVTIFDPANAPPTLTPTPAPTLTPTPLVGAQRLFDFALDWQRSGLNADYDANGNQRIDSPDLLDLIHEWQH